MTEPSNANQPSQIRNTDDQLSETESSDTDTDETIQFNAIGETAQIMHRVSQLEYYTYRLSVRDEFNPLLRGGKLLQQYVTDVYVRTEANRLQWYRSNQKTIRSECYSGLIGHIHNLAEGEKAEVGYSPVNPYRKS